MNILSTIQALTVQEGKKKKLIYDPCEFQLKGIRKKKSPPSQHLPLQALQISACVINSYAEVKQGMRPLSFLT